MCVSLPGSARVSSGRGGIKGFFSKAVSTSVGAIGDLAAKHWRIRLWVNTQPRHPWGPDVSLKDIPSAAAVALPGSESPLVKGQHAVVLDRERAMRASEKAGIVWTNRMELFVGRKGTVLQLKMGGKKRERALCVLRFSKDRGDDCGVEEASEKGGGAVEKGTGG